MITYEEQLTALDESIAHWERLATGKRKEGEYIGMSQCALCKLVDPEEHGCAQCPIAIVNPSNEWCQDTPYEEAAIKANRYDGTTETWIPTLDTPAFLSAAQVELEFLRNVRSKFTK